MLERLEELIAEAEELEKKAYRDLMTQGEKEGILRAKDGKIEILRPYEAEPSEEAKRLSRIHECAFKLSLRLSGARSSYLKLKALQK